MKKINLPLCAVLIGLSASNIWASHNEERGTLKTSTPPSLLNKKSTKDLLELIQLQGKQAEGLSKALVETVKSNQQSNKKDALFLVDAGLTLKKLHDIYLPTYTKHSSYKEVCSEITEKLKEAKDWTNVYDTHKNKEAKNTLSMFTRSLGKACLNKKDDNNIKEGSHTITECYKSMQSSYKNFILMTLGCSLEDLFKEKGKK